MRKLLAVTEVLAALVFLSVPVLAATTVTVDENKVTVNRDQPGASTTTVVQPVVPVVSETVVLQSPTVVITKTEDPRELEGQIIRVDYPKSEIVVEDINGRDRRVLLKQGMINYYKVDDYVKIHLMADLREAKTIKTQRTADLDAEIVSIDYTNNLIIVHNRDGRDVRVLIRPGMVNHYKAGDHVRLYVASDYPDLQEAKMIRVR